VHDDRRIRIFQRINQRPPVVDGQWIDEINVFPVDYLIETG